LQTLCDIIDPSAAGAVGLDATLVNMDVCAAAEGGKPSITARAPIVMTDLAESEPDLVVREKRLELYSTRFLA